MCALISYAARETPLLEHYSLGFLPSLLYSVRFTTLLGWRDGCVQMGTACAVLHMDHGPFFAALRATVFD